MIKIEKIHETMYRNISDLDLKRYFPETGNPNDNVIKYNELSEISTLNDILPNDKSFKIVLIEDSYNRGHWCAIIRTGKTYIWFDSYGLEPDGELKFINAIQKKLLGQDKKYLTHLLAKLPKGTKKIWNKMKLQKVKNGSNTCGRWCILFIILVRDFNFTLDEFQAFIKRWTEKLGLTSDELVSLWVQ